MYKKLKIDKTTEYFVTRKMLFLDRFIGNCIGKKALDVGCNEGYISEFLYGRGYKVLGIEPEEKMYKILKKKEKNFMSEKIHFEQISAENISIVQDNSIDLVVCFDTLEHIEDRVSALREINRVLTEDGLAIFSVPNTFSYFYLRSLITFLIRGFKPHKNIHYQQNFWHWEHLLNKYLEIKEVKPILAIPFFEPKLISRDRLSKFEYDKDNLACISAEPIFICKKRLKKQQSDTDDTEDWRKNVE